MSFGLILTPGSAAFTAAAAEASDPTTRFGVQLARAGRTLDLAGSWHVLAGAEGFDDIAVEPVTESLPDLFGEVDLGVAVGARDVFLPLLLDCASGAEWEQARRDLRAVSNALAGPVTVRVIRPDGTTREITGRASIRTDSWDVATWSVRGWQVFGLLVHCTSPWWRTPAVVRVPWTSAAGIGWFGVRIDQLALAPAQVPGAVVEVDVPGDVETYPTLVVTGAADIVTVQDVTSGRSWSVDCSGLTSPVTVVTDPTASSVTDGAGADQWDRVPAPADLWPLQPGTAQVIVDVAGAAPGAEAVLTADALHMAAVA